MVPFVRPQYDFRKKRIICKALTPGPPPIALGPQYSACICVAFSTHPHAQKARICHSCGTGTCTEYCTKGQCVPWTFQLFRRLYRVYIGITEKKMEINVMGLHRV